jgi:beta-lactam-binding protein with PASTA domain
VKGMTLEEAKGVLEKHNLVLSNISKEDSDDPDMVDKVIKQNPLAASTGKAGQKVDITIATKK